MNNTLKNNLKNSALGSMLKIFLYLVKLPKIVKQLNNDIQNINGSIVDLSGLITDYGINLKRIKNNVLDQDSKLNSLDIKISEIYSNQISNKVAVDTSRKTIINNTMSDNPQNDRFYKEFEDKFRGSEKDIIDRLTEYLPILKNIPKKTKKYPALDIGCGRGEFLSILKAANIKPVGVDINEEMIKRVKSQGYVAHRSDALSYLLKQKSESISVISGFHIVEHIPFEVLLDIFKECYRVVNREGLVIFETPNPYNLVVGSSSFYLDPSHIKPIPPDLLSYALESSGFHCKILPLHPVIKNIDHPDPIVRSIMGMVYGPQDYAILASKKPFNLIQE